MPYQTPADRLNDQILEVFALDPSVIESISSEKMGDIFAINVRLLPDYPPCPRCHFEKPCISNYVPKVITHSVLQSEKCILKYQARRYKCPLCSRTYYEKNPFVFKRQRISVHTVMDILEDLRSPSATFSSVANKHHVSPTTAQKIFDQHVFFPLPKKLPTVIQIDETYSFQSKDSKYVCMIYDYLGQKPVDLLPSRRKDFLLKYFRQFPLEERQKVRYISTDMYRTYRDVIHICFKNAVHAVDPFHVTQDYQRKLTNIRTRIMKGYKSSSDAYYLLKHQNGLLNIRPDALMKVDGVKMYRFDPAAPTKYNYHFKKYMNDYELLQRILAINPDLRKAYEMKNKLSDLFRLTDVNEAERSLRELIRQLNTSGVTELVSAAETLLNWFQEILNSFTIVKVEYEVSSRDGSVRRKDRRLTSSMIENRNKIIKMIKHNSNGYTNWERFRNRCLYVLTPNAPISLEPKG